MRRVQLSPFEANFINFRSGLVGRGRHALQRAGLACRCRPDSADFPTGERAVRRELLHLLRDFSQSAILRDMSGNSADISKGYFYKPIGSSNPLWSASKSMILHRQMSRTQLCRHFRRLATAVARVGHGESELLAVYTFRGGRFSERDFASGFLCE
jgi:hypothetical protein